MEAVSDRLVVSDKEVKKVGQKIDKLYSEKRVAQTKGKAYIQEQIKILKEKAKLVGQRGRLQDTLEGAGKEMNTQTLAMSDISKKSYLTNCKRLPNGFGDDPEFLEYAMPLLKDLSCHLDITEPSANVLTLQEMLARNCLHFSYFVLLPQSECIILS